MIIRGQSNKSIKFMGMVNILFDKLTNIETVFITSLNLNIYSVCKLLSVYLQTKSLNYMHAWSTIKTLKNQILNKRNNEEFNICIKYARI